MPCPLNGIVLPCHGAVGEDGVVGIAFVGTFDVSASGDGEAVGKFCSSFGDEQVIVAVFLVDMRAFGVSSSCALPECFAGRKLLAALGVNLAQHNGVVGVADHVAFSVFKIERGVNTLLLQPYWFAPCASGVLGGHEEVTAVADIGGNHVVSAIVIADGGGINALPRGGAFEVHLRVAVKHVAYLFPMHKVFGVEQWHAGEVLEGGVH